MERTASRVRMLDYPRIGLGVGDENRLARFGYFSGNTLLLQGIQDFELSKNLPLLILPRRASPSFDAGEENPSVINSPWLPLSSFRRHRRSWPPSSSPPVCVVGTNLCGPPLMPELCIDSTIIFFSFCGQFSHLEELIIFACTFDANTSIPKFPRLLGQKEEEHSLPKRIRLLRNLLYRSRKFTTPQNIHEFF